MMVETRKIRLKNVVCKKRNVRFPAKMLWNHWFQSQKTVETTGFYWEYNISSINRRGTKSQSSKIENFLFEVFAQKGSKNIFDMTTYKKEENQLFL